MKPLDIDAANDLAQLFDRNSPVTYPYASRWHYVGSVLARRRRRTLALVKMGALFAAGALFFAREFGRTPPTVRSSRS